MIHAPDTSQRNLGSFAARAPIFLAFWIVLAGVQPIDLAVGAIAASLATWVSLRLLPPGHFNVRPVALARYAVRFMGGSIKAGLDVAWRALHPDMPLRPGFVVYRTGIPQGPERNVFCMITSLLPGTLPTGPDGEDGVIVHCLDIGQPVADELATEEALLMKALCGESANE